MYILHLQTLTPISSNFRYTAPTLSYSPVACVISFRTLHAEEAHIPARNDAS